MSLFNDSFNRIKDIENNKASKSYVDGAVSGLSVALGLDSLGTIAEGGLIASL